MMPITFIPYVIGGVTVVGLGVVALLFGEPTRVMVVGPRKAGKTSWVRSLQGKSAGTYEPTQELEPSVKIAIGKSKIEVSIRDSAGGKSAIDAWKKAFSKQQKVLFFVDASKLGIDEYDQSLVEFMQPFRTLKLGSKLVIVLTHIDLLFASRRFATEAAVRDWDFVRNLAGQVGSPRVILATTNTKQGCRELANRLAEILEQK